MGHIPAQRKVPYFNPRQISAAGAEATSFLSGPFALPRLLSARNIRDSSQSKNFRKAEIVADK